MKILIPLLLTSAAFAAPFSAIEPQTVWKKKAVKVCFGTDADLGRTPYSGKYAEILPYTSEQKALLKSVVTREFTPQTTGIHFVGWEDCSVTLNPDTIIFREEGSTGGSATMGFHGALDENGYRSVPTNLKTFVHLTTNVDPIKLTADERLSFIALHEFGHLAGLRHEQIRKEIKDDWICAMTGYEEDFEEPFDSTRFTSIFDSYSIMSYCYLNFLSKYAGTSFKESDFKPLPMKDDKIISREPDGKIRLTIGLSSLDQHALRCLYVYTPEAKKAICHENHSGAK